MKAAGIKPVPYRRLIGMKKADTFLRNAWTKLVLCQSCALQKQVRAISTCSSFRVVEWLVEWLANLLLYCPGEVRRP